MVTVVDDPDGAYRRVDLFAWRADGPEGGIDAALLHRGHGRGDVGVREGDDVELGDGLELPPLGDGQKRPHRPQVHAADLARQPPVVARRRRGCLSDDTLG
ncbi:hypothetical protein ACFHW0_26015 [Micromonospora sp. LOL_025]|uniref:hypothetical protein n=1 Tax=Micromonospora sp. LOL_025 TaxID=3345413 RepID=UPI003A87A968